MEQTTTEEPCGVRTSQRLKALKIAARTKRNNKNNNKNNTNTNTNNEAKKKKNKNKKKDQQPNTLQSKSDFLNEHLNNRSPSGNKNSKSSTLNQPSNNQKNKKKRTSRRNTPASGANMSTLSSRDTVQLLDHPPLDPQTTQIGFVENVDFIRLEDSGDEANPTNGKRTITTNTNTPNRSGRNRGTKRKFDASTITEEQANSVRKKKGSIITPWFDKLSWRRRNVQQMLTAEIGSFVGYIQPTHEEHQLRVMIIQMIRKVIQYKWPDADVEPFGSFGSKLYLPVGDIDLVILSTKMMSQPKSKILYKLAPLLREHNIGQDVTVIAKAKVPIIKFKTIHGNINVDISINQTNGLVALKKVNELLEDLKLTSPSPPSSNHRSSRDRDSHPRRDNDHLRPPPSPIEPTSRHEESIRHIVDELGAARCLILVIKSVLKQRGMNEVYTGGLGSYSIICLVVSFLQLHPKIQRGDIDPNKNLGVLLLEFFELYGKHFNFDQTGISVRRGGYYFSKAHRGWQRERQPYLLSIEDPADENNDISSNSHNILSVRTVFAGAFDLLSATLYHRHSLQSSRSGAHDKFAPPRPLLSVPVPKQTPIEEEDGQNLTKDPMDESLLGEIMGVTKELVEHRKKNVKLFYSGTLQRLLQLSPPKPAGSTEHLPPQNSSLSREDYPNEHGSGSLRQDVSHHAGSRGGLTGPEEDIEASRKHLSTKDSNRPGTVRRVVRYDFDELIDSPCPPKKTESQRKKKRKGQKNDSPHQLWVEDLEPTEVQILKRNLFSTEAQLDLVPKPTVEQAQVESVTDQLDRGIQDTPTTRKSSVDQKRRYSGPEDHSPELKNQTIMDEGADEAMDSKYRSVQKTRVHQLTLNFEGTSSPSPSGSKPLPQLYIEDDEDSESDLSEDDDLVDEKIVQSLREERARNDDKGKEERVKETLEQEQQQQQREVEEEEEESLPGTPPPLPGTPEGSPGGSAPIPTKEREEVEEITDKLLDSLPGTPPSPPDSSSILPPVLHSPKKNRLDSQSKQHHWLSKALPVPPSNIHHLDHDQDLD